CRPVSSKQSKSTSLSNILTSSSSSVMVNVISLPPSKSTTLNKPVCWARMRSENLLMVGFPVGCVRARSFGHASGAHWRTSTARKSKRRRAAFQERAESSDGVDAGLSRERDGECRMVHVGDSGKGGSRGENLLATERRGKTRVAFVLGLARLPCRAGPPSLQGRLFG